MRRNPFASWILLAVSVMLVGTPTARAACEAANPSSSVPESTPTSAFTINGNGTVTHAITGLTWKQCAEGLSGANCTTGTAAVMNWADALKAANTANTAVFAGFMDWRLPNKKELESIVEYCGFSPAINRAVFPATPGSGFWTGSSYVPFPSFAWGIGFDIGNSDASDKALGGQVRLVRGGQPLDHFDLLNGPFAVAYNGNGADNGAVPVDALSPYAVGATVSVLGNTASRLVKTGNVFAGWCQDSTTCTTPLHGGATFLMPTRTSAPWNLTLYAQWTPATAPVSGLPDTGQSQCDDGLNALNPCSVANTGDGATYPRQDGRFGRDARQTRGTLAKVGGGAAGFDYTKVANNGTDLAAAATQGTGATDWACTRDNITGLIWEVKTATIATDLRHFGHTYTWYSTDAATNAGNVGAVGGNTCNSTLAAYSNQCNTQNYIAAVNAAKLCNASDWRLPTRRELLTLVHAGSTVDPRIDTTYFPHMPPAPAASFFWSVSSYVADPTAAWAVVFNSGNSGAGVKTTGYYVRLVRGGQF